MTSLLTLAIAVGPLLAEEWPRFRGPNGSGVSASRGLPVEFGPDHNVKWAVEIPFGRSSPAFGRDRIFVTATDEEGLVTLALDRSSGRTVWRRTVDKAEAADLYSGNDSASPTPVTDGSNVYVVFHEAGVVSYDDVGEERWRHSLGSFRNFYGVSASPVLAGSRLLVLCEQAVGSFLLALDKDTGERLWRAERPARRESYTTPILYPGEESPRELLVYGSRWIDAYDLETGEVTWSLGGVSAGPVASPVLEGDLLFVTGHDQEPEPLPPFSEIAGKHDANGDDCLTETELEGSWMAAHVGWLDVDASGCVSADDWSAMDREMGTEEWGAFAIQLDGEGRQPKTLWNYRRNVAYIPSPVVYDDVFYMARGGIVTSLDARTGEVHKRGRLARGKMKVYASPVAGDGKIYFASVEGRLAVVKARPQWEVLALNDLGDEIYASPAIVAGHLYVRTKGRLYCFAAAPASLD
jgi:outer membrane protein assembly factor BamB